MEHDDAPASVVSEIDSADVMEREAEYERLVQEGSYYDELLRMGHVVARVADTKAWRAEIKAKARADQIKVRTGLSRTRLRPVPEASSIEVEPRRLLGERREAALVRHARLHQALELVARVTPSGNPRAKIHHRELEYVLVAFVDCRHHCTDRRVVAPLDRVVDQLAE